MFKCKNKLIKEYNFDIRDYNKLNNTIIKIKPKYIFFLAAQSR